MTIEWVIVGSKVAIENATSLLVGKRIKWKTPGKRRISPCQFSDEYEGTAIFALPASSKPSVCPEVNKAKPSQCSGMGNGKEGSSCNDRMIVRIDRVHARTGKPLQPIYMAPRLGSIFAREV